MSPLSVQAAADTPFGKHLASRRHCTISAICDINEVRGRLAAEKLNVPVFYADLKQMLKKEKPDAVIITTPDAAHEECAVTALKHKVNVLIDKPLATSVKGCKHIIREAEKSGKTVMMGFNLRHAPLLVKLKEIVDEGVLGKVFLIENREFYDGGRTYMARWNGRKSSSGGLWIHKGSHDFDIFNWILGFPTPRKVTAFAGMKCLYPGRFPFYSGERKGAGTRMCGMPLCEEWTLQRRLSPAGRRIWGKEAQKKDGYVKDSCMYLSDLSVHDNGFAVVEYENGARACHMECFVAGMSDRFYTVVGTHGLATLSLSGRTITVTKRWGGERDPFMRFPRSISGDMRERIRVWWKASCALFRDWNPTAPPSNRECFPLPSEKRRNSPAKKTASYF